MIKQEDITIIVAALQFWAEEMNSQDHHLLKIYSGDPSANQTWTSAEIQQLRTQLKTANLKFAISKDQGELRTTNLYSTSEEARLAKTVPTDQIATLLLPDSSPQV